MPDRFSNSYSSFFDFIKSPFSEGPVTSTITDKVKIFIQLFLLEILLVLCCGIIITRLGKNDLQILENHKVQGIFKNFPGWYTYVVFILCIPLIEELFFRLHLRIKEKYIYINCLIVISGAILIGVQLFKVNYIRLMILVIGIILILIYFIKRVKINQSILIFWRLKYFYVFYTTVAIFGLLHITNFNVRTITILLIPILIMPQLILGLFCGYIRLRLGFFWGCLFHISHNFIYLLPFLITSLIPISYNKSVKIVEQSSSSTEKFWRITNDTIEFDRLKIKDIIPRLVNIEKEYIEFEDSTIAEKTITLHYSRGIEKSYGKLKSSCSIALFELLRKYNLKMEQKSFEKDIYQLQVIDSLKLNLFNKSQTDTLTTLTFPIFYDNEITLHNAYLNLIAKTISLNFNEKVVGPLNSPNKFTIMIPKLRFKELNQFINEHYGINLNKSVGKVYGYKISNKKKI